MARPKKERVICAMPRFRDFSPTEQAKDKC